MEDCWLNDILEDLPFAINQTKTAVIFFLRKNLTPVFYNIIFFYFSQVLFSMSNYKPVIDYIQIRKTKPVPVWFKYSIGLHEISKSRLIPNFKSTRI